MMVSLGVLTSITLTSIPIQIVEAQSNENCTSFEITDEHITSERCTVQGKDPSITDTTCIDGEYSSQTSGEDNQEVAQARQGSKQLCKEYTRENRDNPDPWFTCITK